MTPCHLPLPEKPENNTTATTSDSEVQSQVPQDGKASDKAAASYPPPQSTMDPVVTSKVASEPGSE